MLTVPEMGWSGIKNGDLLQRMQTKGLKVLLSIDKNMSHQQNLEKHNISLIVFNSNDTRYNALAEFIPKVENILSTEVKPGLIIVDK